MGDGAAEGRDEGARSVIILVLVPMWGCVFRRRSMVWGKDAWRLRRGRMSVAGSDDLSWMEVAVNSGNLTMQAVRASSALLYVTTVNMRCAEDLVNMVFDALDRAEMVARYREPMQPHAATPRHATPKTDPLHLSKDSSKIITPDITIAPPRRVTQRATQKPTSRLAQHQAHAMFRRRLGCFRLAGG